jgi:hypothetical protein
VCKAAPDEIPQLEHFGVTFHRSGAGELGTRAFGVGGRTFYVADITDQDAAARRLRAPAGARVHGGSSAATRCAASHPGLGSARILPTAWSLHRPEETLAGCER